MKLPVLSYTFLRDYENCPRKAWHRSVAKDLPKEPMSPEMQYGILVHKNFEIILRPTSRPETIPSLVVQAKLPAKLVEPILAAPGMRLVEASLGMTENGRPTGFWDQNVWLRGKIDVAIVDDATAFIIDWKTGKPWEDPAELEIFSLLLQSHYPEVQQVAGNYVWLKQDRLGELYDLSDVQKRWTQVHLSWETMHWGDIANEWAPTPNKLCGWCPVKTCEYWRPNENA